MHFKFGVFDSPLSCFCNEESETLEHFCLHCKIVSLFLKDHKGNNIPKSQKLISAPFDIKDIFSLELFMRLTTMFLLTTYFTYRSILNKSSPPPPPHPSPLVCL